MTAETPVDLWEGYVPLKGTDWLKKVRLYPSRPAPCRVQVELYEYVRSDGRFKIGEAHWYSARDWFVQRNHKAPGTPRHWCMTMDFPRRFGSWAAARNAIDKRFPIDLAARDKARDLMAKEMAQHPSATYAELGETAQAMVRARLEGPTP